MVHHKSHANRPRRVNLAGRQVESIGLGTDFWSDFSHRCLTASWPVFFGGAAAAYFIMNCLFALIYMLGDRPIANAPGDFLHYLYFSIETLATVGYGDMHPQTHFGHVVASVEMFAGVFATAVLAGLIFYRFSRPNARIVFAESAVITTHDGRPSLMLRVANERQNYITGPTAKLWFTTTTTTAEGATFRRFAEVPLLRSQNPLFVLSWTIIHVIDEASPLYGLDAEAMIAAEAAVMVMIEGYDESSAQVVRARKTYRAEQIVIGHRYVDVLESAGDDTVRLNYRKFHMTEPE